ncbi:sugar ABC transporter ATP-binding protein [Nocardia sp. CDC160]|uniref:sugar ABC transporter ATP-binding protein n=1 Tax=Nocardia sp. CDC160 TaxID=3112166 RepID=UPI002DBF3ACB|nr:sugar ABC transporter ATP-binding protein [Nocardia sp. CDC160]MEC3918539.1 sugar ABC transporter ATP-binding protein [Nocardia sp. CDC160]
MSRTDSGEAAEAAASTPVVELDGVGMSFGGRSVLEGVSLELAAGRVVALLGANGAGKSTLIKVLSGMYPGHRGQIRIDGVAARLHSPAAARGLGIRTVHQHIGDTIVPGLSVAENLVFEELVGGRGGVLLNGSRILARAREIQAVLDLDWDDRRLRSDVAELGISDQQLLILARALATRPRLLILDEPTSALSAAEARRLFAIVERLRDAGIAILYVSHRLGEIDSLADDLVVLHEGRISDVQQRPFDWDAALGAMLATAHSAATRRPEDAGARGGEPVLSLRGVPLRAGRRPLDLDLRAGEVTGVVGLLGAGKTELARGVFGADRFDGGSMLLDGKLFRPRHPVEAIRGGVHLVPEDRHADALVPGWSIAENVTLPFLRTVSSRWGWIGHGREATAGRHVIDTLGVVARDEGSRIEELSGGNQQKVVVGRWLARTPRVLVLDEPFRGVDLGARRDIGRRARAVSAEGGAVLLLSADVDEVLEVADRVIVLVDGEIRLDTYDPEPDRIVQALAAV